MMRIKFQMICTVLFAGFFLSACGGKSDDAGHDSHDGHAAEEAHDEEEGKHDDEVHLTTNQIINAGVKTALVKKQSLGIEIEVLGEIASDTDQVVQLRPMKPGTVSEVLAAVGDTTEAGEVLVRYSVEGEPNLHELKASKTGVVVGLYAESGGHVDPAVPLVTLADTTNLRCGLDVYEKDIGRVKKGQSVRIKVAAYPNESFSGRISYISPRVDENSRTIKIRADIGNPMGKLKFGMFVRGFIRTGGRWVIVIPEISIQKIEGLPTVFVAEEGEEGAFVPRKVELGETSGGLVEVKSGLSIGERVVTHGSFILKSELSKGEMGEGHSH